MIIMKDNYLIQVPDIHIGNEILSFLKSKGIYITTLARTIRMDPSNLGRTLKRKSMETLMLIKISQAIGHNFFLLWIEDTTPEQFSSTIAEEPNEAIGNSVKIRMNELNITQKVFAARLGITQPGINRLLNKTSINTDYLAHISRLLGKNFFKEFCRDTEYVNAYLKDEDFYISEVNIGALIDKKMNRTDLKDASGISFNVLAKMGKKRICLYGKPA